MEASTSASTCSKPADAEENAIRRILLASNHFDMLRLPRPHGDVMDKPVWDVTSDAVHRAFRKASLVCHPDKSSHPDAPRAFEALKRAKRCLSEPLDRDDYLLNFIRQQKVRWEGNWTSVEVSNESKQRMALMREEAQRADADSVAEAMRERRERAEAAARKHDRQQLHAAQRRHRRAAERSEAAQEEEDEDEDEDDSNKPPAISHGHGKAGSSIRRAAGGVGGGARKRPKFL